MFGTYKSFIGMPNVPKREEPEAVGREDINRFTHEKGEGSGGCYEDKSRQRSLEG